MKSVNQPKLAKASAEAARPGQSAAGGSWTITSRPCSNESYDCEEQLASISCNSMRYGDHALWLSIKPSTDWTADDLEQLSTLVQSRNRFVCLQLKTMVNEQYEKVARARSAGDAIGLHTARFMYLATVNLQDTGGVVAAGLFYPRQCSKDGVDMPHMYVELLCCNSPGRGYGSVLLHHIEQYTAAGCECISAGFFDNQPTAGSTCGENSAVLFSSTDTSSAVVSQLAPVLPLLASRVVPVDPLTGCCAACGEYDSSSSCSSHSKHSSMLSSCTANLLAIATCTQPPAATCGTTSGDASQQQQPQLPLASTESTADAVAAEAVDGLAARKCCKRICGIKLLSVASAQAFYAHNGYGTPDVCKEMFKSLLPTRGIVGSASTSSICSMMSVSSSSSISRTVC